tara:strand:- start:556 stop:747 length:192 start_codon:yes stop_codon:yes gene_type:complete
MRNRELFKQKLTRIDGKLKTLRVMATRQGTTIHDLDKILDDINEHLGDLSTMVEREGKDAYGR